MLDKQLSIKSFIIGQSFNQQLYLCINLTYQKSMKLANQHRVQKTIIAFSLIVTVLSLGHFIALQFSIQLAKDLDDHQTDLYGDKQINFWCNLPFAIILGFFAVLQVFSAFMIFISSLKPNSTKTVYYCSIIGMLVSFSIGVQLTILASQYNTFTREWHKDTDMLPQLMPFYWTIQVDATTSFLFILPMMGFIFYHKLNQYLAIQREQAKQNPNPQNESDKQGFFLCVFMLNTLAQIAFIFNIYQLSTRQDPYNYAYDNLVDQYTYYLDVGVVIALVAIILQICNIRSQFLSKRHIIMLSVIVGLFQFGSLILMAIKTIQIFIWLQLIEKDTGLFPNREAAITFKWEILGYTAVNLVSVLLQGPYLKLVSIKKEKEIERDTLITTEQNVTNDS